MSTRITKRAALKALDQAVAKRGADYVYPMPNDKCVYVYNGAPSCIVGEVLAQEVPIDELQQLEVRESNTAPLTLTSTRRTIACMFEVTFTDGALKVLREAQVEQDCGTTWADAVERAKAAR